MKRLSIATKGCGKLTSNYTYFSDSWFSSAENSEDAMDAGVDYCGPVKKIHNGFCLSKLEKLMKHWLSGGVISCYEE